MSKYGDRLREKLKDPRSLSQRAYEDSSFGKAVKIFDKPNRTYKKPLEVMPKNQREIKYADGTSEYEMNTKDSYAKGNRSFKKLAKRV